MVKHRTHSVEFKRQVVQEYLGGETLQATGWAMMVRPAEDLQR